MGDSMSSVIISGDTSGAITLSAPSVAGTNTATLPAATGTVMVSGNMPAFSANNPSTQAVSSGTDTKALFPTEVFDTNSNFASSRFTPTVAGYYQLSSGIYSGNNTGFFNVTIYKNGGVLQELGRGNGSALLVGGSALVQANGTTDYFEIYVYTSGSSLTIGAGSAYMWFTGFLARNS